MTLSLESTAKLASGHLIPRLGYGVYQARGGECEAAVREALTVGYRHIDSAQAYRNEEIVGRAVASSSPSIPRSSIFITTKYMSTHKVYSSADVLSHLRKSLQKIDQSGSDKPYIDLMLIHAPWGGQEGRKNNWEALVQAQKEGWVRDIGVSNFGVRHLQELPSPTPAVNQIELHPFCQQRDIVEYCQKNGILVQAYSPLVRAQEEQYKDPVLVKVAEKHGKEVAQVLIRWSLQKGFVPLPKSVTPSRIKSNTDVFDFELDEEDMEAIDGLDKGSAGAVTWNPVNYTDDEGGK
ncbi:hypothetical protein IAT38_000824 [Cryptococcus sp. DSM 104549]